MKTSKKPKIASSSASAQQSLESRSQVDEFMRGVNEAAIRLMRALSPTNDDVQSPRLEARDYEREDEEEGGLWTFAGNKRISDGGSRRTGNRSVADQSVATSQRTPLDLHHNDNTFHVLANLIVEFLEAKLTQDGKTVVLQPEDRVRMERVLPQTVRLDFIDALRFRLERTPEHAATPIHYITLQCQELGLDREGRRNPILVAANLENEPSFIPVNSNLITSRTYSFQSEPALSFNPTPIVYEENEEDLRDSQEEDEGQGEVSEDDVPDNVPVDTHADTETGIWNAEIKDDPKSDHNSKSHNNTTSAKIEPAHIAQPICDEIESTDNDNLGVLNPDVGAHRHYHRSMVSTMTTMEDDEERNPGEVGAAEGSKEDQQELQNNSITESIGNLTPLGVEMTFSEADTISKIADDVMKIELPPRVQRKSEPHGLSPTDGPEMNRSASENEADNFSAEESRQYKPDEKLTDKETRGICVTIPSFESPSASELLSALVPTPSLGLQSPTSTVASSEFQTHLSSAISSSSSSESGPSGTTTSDVPSTDLDSSVHWQHGESRYPERVVSDETITVEFTPIHSAVAGRREESKPLASGRPPLPPTSSVPVLDVRHFWQGESESIISLTDTPTITSMCTGSNTMDSVNNLFSINPFANLAALGKTFTSIGASDSRSILQEQLEQKKRDIAVRAQLSQDYALSEASPSTEARDMRIDHESLARQQLMAELREATTLVLESENPEISKFWEDHVTYLQFRLRALDGQDLYAEDEEFTAEIAESNRRLISEIAQREQYLPQDEDTVQPEIVGATHDKSAPCSQENVEGDRDHVQTTCQETIEPLENTVSEPTEVPMGVASTNGAMLRDATLQNTLSDAVATSEGVVCRNFNESENGTMCRSASAECNFTNEDGNEQQPLPEPHYELPMVDVVAPADLPGGYHFEAEIEGKRFLATVPQGGVQQGETFTCYMRDLDSVAIDIPVGYWKDNLSSLCDYGCCHPVIWNSLFCPLGKVLI